MIDVVELTRAASCLEPLPVSVTRLAALVCDPAPELAAVIEIVQYDEALTANLLRAANSSWSASRVEVATVKDAVIRLGAGPVLSLALAVNVRARLSDSVPEYELAEGELWRHSVAASLAVELISLHAQHRPPTEAATAALLHDVGKLVMGRFLAPELLAEITTVRAAGASRVEAERAVLGIDHAHLGGVVADSWGLPQALAHAITYHHEPQVAHGPPNPRDPLNTLPSAVHLAAVAARRIATPDGPGPDVAAFEHGLAVLGLDAPGFDDVCRTTETRLNAVLERFS